MAGDVAVFKIIFLDLCAKEYAYVSRCVLYYHCVRQLRNVRRWSSILCILMVKLCSSVDIYQAINETDGKDAVVSLHGRHILYFLDSVPLIISILFICFSSNY